MLKHPLLVAGFCAGLILPSWAHATETAQNSSELRQFIQQLWQQSPELAAAKAAIEAARAQAHAASQPLYNPSLQLDAERSDISSATLGLSQTLDWHDKRLARQNRARKAISAYQTRLHLIRTQLSNDTLLALSRYQTTQQLFALASQRSELMQRFSSSVQTRYRAGDMRLLDTALAKLAYSEAVMQQASRAADLADNEATLHALTGVSRNWPQLATNTPYPPVTIETEALLENLAEMQMQRAQLILSKNRIRQAEQEQQADPTLGLSGGRDGSENRIGLSLEIPLFIRNDFSAEVLATRHQAQQAEQDYLTQQRRARAKLNGALKRFQTMNQAWQGWLKSGQQAQNDQKKWLEQLWNAGELSASDYLLQAKQSIDTQVAALSLKGELQQAHLLWLSASGQMNDWLNLSTQASPSGEQQ
ncbi:MAG: TolC family protein [Gammaproteobacteria bacterium]|nr:TolC family protein [Gammaproteobacteria bacterium]